ncbi:MAG: hypothetical protein VYE73_05325 [Acidobacteriota bacterium]|nr:hypothetical protein [Acidobacteriota bacterium]
MDPEKLTALLARIDYLDERWTYRIRPEKGGSMIRPSEEEVDRRQRELANYTIEIKDILRELLEELRPPETE